MILWLYMLMLAAQFGLWVLLLASPVVRSETLPSGAFVSRVLLAMLFFGLVLSVLGPGYLAGRGSWFG
jgi:nitrate reductase gamma subunit